MTTDNSLKSSITNNSPLFALTTAALVLPGLLQVPAQAAEGDSVDFQYSHYQEGKRDISLPTGNSVYDPATNTSKN